MSSCYHSVRHIAANFHFFVDAFHVPDVNSQRVFGHFHRSICILWIEKFAPLSPWHCIELTWWIRFESTALFTCHVRCIFRLTYLMQNTSDDTGTIIAPILPVEIVYEITGKSPKIVRSLLVICELFMLCFISYSCYLIQSVAISWPIPL